MKKLRKNNKGFSLVELIVVIAIMAVLVGVLAPQFMGYVTRSRISTDIQNVETVLNAVDVYAADNAIESDSAISALVSVTTDASGKVTGIDVDSAVTNVSDVTFKYTGWTSVSITYAAGKWTVAGTSGTVNGTTYSLAGN